MQTMRLEMETKSKRQETKILPSLQTV